MGKGCGHIYSKVLLHLNWHCKDSIPLITPDLEPTLYAYIEEYCQKVKGVHFICIGGTATHIHLVFQMEPTVDLDAFIGHIKGASSHEINARFGTGALHWQRGYGLVSFAEKDLVLVERYVHEQKIRHARSRVNGTLERYQDI